MNFGGLLVTVLEFGRAKLASVLKISDARDDLLKTDPDAWVFGYYHFRAAKVFEALKAARAAGGDTNQVLETLGINIPEDD